MYNAGLQCAPSADAAPVDVHLSIQEKVPETLVYFSTVAEAGLESQEMVRALEKHGMICFAETRG
jgi:hypothetical protein